MNVEKALKGIATMTVFTKKVENVDIMSIGMSTTSESAKKVYRVKESKYKLGKNFGESITEVFIEELGWCRYSWETTGILVNGKWLFDWESFEPDSE